MLVGGHHVAGAVDSDKGKAVLIVRNLQKGDNNWCELYAMKDWQKKKKNQEKKRCGRECWWVGTMWPEPWTVTKERPCS